MSNEEQRKELARRSEFLSGRSGSTALLKSSLIEGSSRLEHSQTEQMAVEEIKIVE